MIVVVSLPEDAALPEALVPKEVPLTAWVVSLAPELPCEPESATALPVFAELLVQADKAILAINIIAKLNFFMLKLSYYKL